jgi:hypothetical protein
MKKEFTEKELISFGNYLLSNERNERVSVINKQVVNDADFQNWWIHETADLSDFEFSEKEIGNKFIVVGDIGVHYFEMFTIVVLLGIFKSGDGRFDSRYHCAAAVDGKIISFHCEFEELERI